MSPPLSRLERGDPPPRRKSCQACVKAKRRCDLRLPGCFRCAQRQIPCQYPSRSARMHPSQTPLSAETPTTVQALVGNGSATENGFSLGTTGPSEHEEQVPETPVPDSDVSLGTADPLLPHELANIQDWELHYSDIPSEANGIDDALGFSDDFSAFAPPMDIAARPPLGFSAPGRVDVAAIYDMLEIRLSYAVDRIRDAPREMLSETQTPWCHPRLYREEMPRAMQDAISSCALYVSKNTVNGPLVMRCISTKMNDLLDSPMPTRPLDILARTQALLLYLVIQFFDGDIVARSSADTAISELQSLVYALMEHISWDVPGELISTPTSQRQQEDLHVPLFPMSAPLGFWKEWMFQESARRTFLIASFFTNTWKLLTGRQTAACRDDPPLMRQSWTLSAHLWRAQDAFDFTMAWRNKKHYVVTRKTVMSTLADARGDDVENFGKMLLTTALGVDEAKAWLALIGVPLY